MTSNSIEKLIITSPYEEPRQHYSYVRETRTFALKEGRRSAGYIVASEASRTFDDPGISIELPLINQSRECSWRFWKLGLGSIQRYDGRFRDN